MAYWSEIWAARIVLRSSLAIHLGLSKVFKAFHRSRSSARRKSSSKGCSILLTGTFHSENWILNKLRPLVLCDQVSEICVVCTRQIPGLSKAHTICPPAWMRRTIGDTPARLLVFVMEGLRKRPNFVGGYHLLVNGLVAQFLASLIGSKSLYFCGGGPKELIGGGYLAGFSKLREPDPVLEKQLLKAVDRFDCVIAKGPGAVRFFRSRGVRTRFGLIPGGIDSAPFRYAGEEKIYDLILLARLYSSKRVDIFLETVALLARDIPAVRAVIVGSGELESELKSLSSDLKLDRNLEFAGHHDDVGWWLKRSRVFVLTSENEGLAMALVEAMLAGLPAVVPDVGELGSLVHDGVNGYLVADPAPEAFASRIKLLLTDPDVWERFSQAAVKAASPLDLPQTVAAWDAILRDLNPPVTAETAPRCLEAVPR